jgi:hypothetical protein
VVESVAVAVAGAGLVGEAALVALPLALLRFASTASLSALINASIRSTSSSGRNFRPVSLTSERKNDYPQLVASANLGPTHKVTSGMGKQNQSQNKNSRANPVTSSSAFRSLFCTLVLEGLTKHGPQGNKGSLIVAHIPTLEI